MLPAAQSDGVPHFKTSHALQFPLVSIMPTSLMKTEQYPLCPNGLYVLICTSWPEIACHSAYTLVLNILKLFYSILLNDLLQIQWYVVEVEDQWIH
jgi:hypothetical protein